MTGLCSCTVGKIVTLIPISSWIQAQQAIYTGFPWQFCPFFAIKQ